MRIIEYRESANDPKDKKHKMKNENDEKKVEGKADLSVDELEDAAGGYAPRNTPQSTTDRPVIELEEAKKLLPYIFKEKREKD